MSRSRRPRWLRTLLVTAVSLVVAGCSASVFVQKSAVPPTTPARPGAAAKERLPRLLAPPLNPLEQATPPSRPTPEERTFLAGVNGFCRTWYLDQRAADQRFPAPAQHHRFAVLEESQDRLLTQRLARLAPPSSLASAFSGFVANEQGMVGARTKMASADPTTRQEGSDEYNTADVLRHGFARRLGATACDGVLPPDQVTEAERAAQRFDLTTDVREGCVALVTPEFVRREWGSSGDPMGTCRRLFRIHRLGTLPVPHNIRISTVTGVEHVSATVFFREVPDCGCGAMTARLYYEGGRWLVSNMTTG